MHGIGSYESLNSFKGNRCNGVMFYLKITGFGVYSVKEPSLVLCITLFMHHKRLQIKGVSLNFKGV